MNTAIIPEVLNTAIIPEVLNTAIIPEVLNTAIIPEVLNMRIPELGMDHRKWQVKSAPGGSLKDG